MSKSPVALKPTFERDFQSEDDHRTLMRAAEVQGDRKRLAGARRHHRKEERRMTLLKKQMLQGRR